MEKRFVMLEEGFQSDASLDLDGKLCEEHYGKCVNENYDVNELTGRLKDIESQTSTGLR